MRVLFVEPFYGGSHRAFLDGLVEHSAHEIVPLTLPEGEWRRRMRRGAQELAPRALALNGEFDLIIASDMLDLAAFLALTRRRFGRTPVLYYLHENQFTYPRLRGTKFNSWFGQVNYLSALSADVVAFNSAFHRDDFFGALRTLAEQPNNWLVDAAIDGIVAKSGVLPVGVDLAWLEAIRPAERTVGGAPLILWNHRWEFDKAPEVFARAVRRLANEGLAFRVAVAGEPGLTPAPEMASLPAALGERLVQFGRVESREEYGRLLWEADIVVSTTRHEFFGVAMVEALACRCLPIVPARYNYPAFVPPELHGACLWETEEEFVAKLREAVTNPPETASLLSASAARFSWERVAPAWDRVIEDTIRIG